MEEVREKLASLRAQYDALCAQLKLDQHRAERHELEQRTQEEDFWQQPQAAQVIAKKLARLQQRLVAWDQVGQLLGDASELLALEDKSIIDSVQQDLAEVANRLELLKEELKYSGTYDQHDAFMTIFAGAGGTDAQDWAEMLLRMYSRWAESNQMDMELIEQSPGEEAGIKRAVFVISGDFAYGRLRSEHGVHRLVRLSPFNADSLRQTSFAKVEVIPKIDEPKDVVIDDKDLKIDVYRAGGHGGQSVNTTDSAVRVTHVPTGITVAIQNERSQLQNKETALSIVRSRLAQLAAEQHIEALSELKGPNVAAEWGSQIRSYVLHPYTMVKDGRTKFETSDAQKVLDGDLNGFIDAYLAFTLGQNS